MTNYLNVLNQPKPRIDYTLKAVGGSLTAIPGLSDMIDVSSSLGSSSSFKRFYLFPFGLIHSFCFSLC